VIRNHCKRDAAESPAAVATALRPGLDLGGFTRNQLPKASLAEISSDLQRILIGTLLRIEASPAKRDSS